uniref:Large ribosomal subunit protein uL22c n=1 Tax=Monsonia vanderietiae TaxID=28970 RepID=B7T408_MONVN|nr:ribosomal protein L22 [Monsonia vanderietiae]
MKKKKTKRYTEVSALGKYISMSANKARRVIDQIRGRSYDETLMILKFMPYRACDRIFKIIYSAAANGIRNMNFDKRSLIISKAEVNEGPSVKKMKPRARGQGYPIKRPTCHITIVLRDKSLNEKYEEYRRKPWALMEAENRGYSLLIDSIKKRNTPI